MSHERESSVRPEATSDGTHARREHGAAPYDAVMTTPPAPGERRRLERPPGERYVAPPPEAATQQEPKPPRPAVALATGQVIGLLGALAIVLLGNVLEIDLGLIAVAGLVGWLIGGSVSGARPTLKRSTLRAIAIAMALESVALGQLGLWLLSLAQGGVLDPVAYLGQVFGLVVPLQFVAAVGAAWWASR